MYSLIASSCTVISFECRLFIDTDGIASALAPNHSTSRPFRGLELLTVKIAAFSSPLLIHGPKLQSLTNLHLSIVGGEQNVLSSVSGRVQLRILDLHFLINLEEIKFAASELLSLSTLRELREIYVYCDDDVTAPDFTDLLLAQLVASWPHLRV